MHYRGQIAQASGASLPSPYKRADLHAHLRDHCGNDMSHFGDSACNRASCLYELTQCHCSYCSTHFQIVDLAPRHRLS